MAADALFDGFETAGEREAQRRASIKWTERMMLELLRARYEETKGGNGPRYVFAEHVRNEGGFGGWDFEHFKATGKRTTLRTADALAIDLWPSSGHLIHGFEVKVSRWLRAAVKTARRAD